MVEQMSEKLEFFNGTLGYFIYPGKTGVFYYPGKRELWVLSSIY